MGCRDDENDEVLTEAKVIYKQWKRYHQGHITVNLSIGHQITCTIAIVLAKPT